MNALVDLLLGAQQRQFGEDHGMILTVRGDGVAFVVDAPRRRRIGVRLAPDHEESRLHALGCERLEDAIRVGRQRAVVERQDHFLVAERQRLRILHGADAGVLLGRDDEHALGAGGASTAAGTWGAGRRTAEQRGNKKTCGEAAHSDIHGTSLAATGDSGTGGALGLSGTQAMPRPYAAAIKRLVKAPTPSPFSRTSQKWFTASVSIPWQPNGPEGAFSRVWRLFRNVLGPQPPGTPRRRPACRLSPRWVSPPARPCSPVLPARPGLSPIPGP